MKSFQNHGGSNNSTLSSNCELQHQNTSNRVLTNNEKNSLVSDECFMEIKPPKTPLFPKNKDEFIEPSRIVTKDASLSNTKSKVNTYNTHRPETIGKAKEKTDSKLIKSAFENKMITMRLIKLKNHRSRKRHEDSPQAPYQPK